jgi:methylated-DNA-protein-cysteine methyltransferase-like protein
MTKLNEEFIDNILAIVEEIPFGKVMTYGQIAKMAGYNRNARLVGKVMGISGYYGRYPSHRVVSGSGQLVNGWEEQRDLLISEGIEFKKNGQVDLKIFA